MCYVYVEQCYLAKEGGEFDFVCLLQEYPEFPVHSSLLLHYSDMLLQGSRHALWTCQVQRSFLGVLSNTLTHAK